MKQSTDKEHAMEVVKSQKSKVKGPLRGFHGSLSLLSGHLGHPEDQLVRVGRFAAS